MTLLELLVKELPKRGGWPSGFIDERVKNLVITCNVYFGCDAYGAQYFENDSGDVVTRDQYETALAASQKPIAIAVFHSNDGSHGSICAVTVEERADCWMGNKVDGGQYHCLKKFWRVHFLSEQQPVWDGEGLPPVGSQVDIVDIHERLRYGQNESGEVVAHVENTAVVRMSYGLGCFEAEFLRPIRAEAERKREQITEGLIRFLDEETDIDNVFRKSDVLGFIDYIEAGKIPGVKLTGK